MDQEHRGHRGYTEDTEEIHAKLSGALIGCAMKVHSTLGPGLLESAYEESLCYEMSRAGIPFRRQVETTLRYEEINLATGLRIDLLVDNKVIVEVKAVERILPIHEAQLLTYLRCSRMRLGLLMNFNVRHFRDGVRRRVL